MSLHWPIHRIFRYCTLLLASGLVACGTTVSRPKPAELPNVSNSVQVQTLWQATIGRVTASMVPHLTPAATVVLANDASEVFVLQLSDGKVIERVALNQALAAGVGSDGKRHAVVTRQNELLVIEQGKLAWRQSLPAQVFTPPLVAGDRVFVLMADRSVQAFDGASGRRLWTQARPDEILVLAQAGTLMAFNNTLVAGGAGRVTGLDPDTGQIRWDSILTAPRGLNDLERLVDVVGSASRQDHLICVRTYLAHVGCVDATRGQIAWTRIAHGQHGLTGYGPLLVGVESNGRVLAWQRAQGDRRWENEQLKYRRLSAPVLTRQAVWLADDEGMLYLLNPVNGDLLGRLQWSDRSPLASPPLQSQDTVVLVNRNGVVSALRSR